MLRLLIRNVEVKSMQKRHGQSGATLVEAAIALPVLFMLLISSVSFVQLAMAYEQTSMILEDAARKAVLVGSIGGGDSLTCDDRARSLFESGIAEAAVPLTMVSFSMTRNSVDSLGSGSGFAVTSEVRVRCAACALLPGFAQSIFSLNPNLFVPAENSFSCPTL